MGKRFIGNYPKQSNFFLLPNELFQIGLSAQEIAIYAYLMRCERWSDYTCYPSFKTIGKAVKLSRNTVMKYVHQLEEKNLLTVEPTTVRTQANQVRNGTLKYTISPIRYAKEYYNEQLMLQNEIEFEKLRAMQIAEKGGQS